jgi:tRNA A-37 threonylcarbamoyl transferase component Bud32
MHETQIGRYEVVRVLGKGAMGVVCEARDPRLARTVAIKTIRADKLTPAQVAAYEARFLTEARSVARLSHPNIVSVFDSGQSGEMTYLVMEFVPGVNLKHCLNNGVRFTPWGAVKVVLDVLAALNHAHGQKILHRDVKPENILLDAAGWVKLTDFGIAKILDAEEDNGTQLSGHSIGTPRYMSPEQVRGLPLDERSDLFSAGVLLYELLTARLPFDGSNQFAIAAQILNEPAPLPSTLNPAVPAVLDEVVARAMAKHPAERFQTVADFADALIAAVGPLGGGDVTARVPGAQVLVAAESAGMLRWLMSRILTGAGVVSEPDECLPAATPQAGSAGAGSTPGSGNMATSQAGGLPAFGDAVGREPTLDDGTRLFQREAAGLAALSGGASTGTGTSISSGTGTGTSSGSGRETEAGAALGESSGIVAGTGGAAIDTEATVALSVSPVAVPVPVPVSVPFASTLEGVGPRDADATRPARAGGGRWLWGAAAFLLLAVAAWWFARSSAAPGVVPPVPPAVDLADPKQTLSEREALVQPAAAPQNPSSTAAVSGGTPADATKPAAVPPSAGEPAAGVPGAAGGAGTNAAKKPVKPADGAAPVKPAEARGPGKPEEPQPTSSPTATTPPKPAAVAAGSTPVASAEPCSGLGFFERESCLWKQCSTDAYRALPVCERFQSRKPVN